MSIVAIVGRKNVGKSTIFNRLIEKRMSVVYPQPGVTRDRVYGEVNWRGRVFDIIDTGGFSPARNLTLDSKILRQIELALQECDLIYFVVDGRDGLVSSDEEICKRLRRINKPIFLLVNKIDSRGDETRSWEFSKLGIEPVFSVSAEGGIGFGDILDETTKILPKLKSVRENKRIKILILGKPNAGKSTLLNSILKRERAIVDELPGTTRDLVSAKFLYRNKEIEIVDTGGIKRRAQIKNPIEFYSMTRAIRQVERVNIVCLIFDVTERITRQDQRIASLILAKARSLVIAPNKIDLISHSQISKVIPSTRASLEFIDFAPILPISAKQKTGIENLLNTILDVYAEADKIVDKTTLKNLAQNLQPPAAGQILKLTQIDRRPPVFKIKVTTSVEKNYIKYIRRSLRNYFGFRGVPILIKTERVS